jgi:hypothetical protein
MADQTERAARVPDVGNARGQGRTEGLALLLTAAHSMVTALHMHKVHFVPVQCIPTGNNSECCGKTTCGGGQAIADPDANGAAKASLI